MAQPISVGKVVCGTTSCTNDAVWRVCWPAQTMLLCDRCKERAEAVARAMGFSVESFLLEQAGSP